MKTEIDSKKTFRMLCNGEQEWIGKAYNADHAEERCFMDEEPGSLCRYTLQVLVKRGRFSAWHTVYSNETIKTW